MAAAARIKSYKLRLFISLKYITANVLDQSNGNLVQQASTIEHALKHAFDVGHTTSPKSGAIIGEVLARRVKFEALHNHPGLARGLHVDVKKEVEKKGVDDVTANVNIVWAILNALKGNGIKIIVDQDFDYHDSTFWHDKAMLYEQYHWKKAMAKKQPYKFKWNEYMDKYARDSYYFNWPVYFP